jgi:hypothetical protein
MDFLVQRSAETIVGAECESEAQSVGARTRGPSRPVESQQLMGSRKFD